MAPGTFGSVRRLPSGQWQARYIAPDGMRRSAPHTFDTKASAVRWLRLTEAELMRGDWTDSDRARITLTDYAEQWIRERPGLRPRTFELYRWLFTKHIGPHLGGVELGKLTTAMVRRWRADLLAAGVSESVAAKCRAGCAARTGRTPPNGRRSLWRRCSSWPT
jgi:hypothetical protein